MDVQTCEPLPANFIGSFAPGENEFVSFFYDENFFRIDSLHIEFWSVILLPFFCVGHECSFPSSSRILGISLEDAWEDVLAGLMEPRFVFRSNGMICSLSLPLV